MNKDTESCKLKRIRYESSGGSMVYHSEFEIEADADEIIRTGYWSDNYFGSCEEAAPPGTLESIDSSFRAAADAREMTVREHIPMDKTLWDALCGEFLYLADQLSPVKSRKFISAVAPDVFVLDGGDYQRLYITWETGGSEQTVQYYPPTGNRWHSVIQIIHEMARPVGRDLHRIGETQLTEFFLKAPGYSYQITPVKGSDNYYFFVHGDKSDISTVSREQWLTVRDHLTALDVSDLKNGSYESRYYLRLNYNDGINRNLEINKKLAALIREHIRKSILGE